MKLTQELKQEYQMYDQHQLNDAFCTACRHGHMDVVCYLLTSLELYSHADIHAQKDYGFRWACVNGHFEIVKYLLTSPELTEHANIHAQNDYGFRLACKEGHFEIVKYLLSFDVEQRIDFQKTDYSIDWAIENKYSDIVFTMMKSLHRHDIDVFNAHVESVMDYFMAESFEHSVAMMTEFHLKENKEFPTECNLVL